MNLLDTPLSDLHASRPLLDRVLQGIALDQSVSYADAYDRLCNVGATSVLPKPTLGGALEALGVDVSAVERNVKLLDQRDQTVEGTYDGARAERLETDPFGRVLLSQSYSKRPKSLDADGRLMDTAEFEKRLRRARKLDGRYAGDAGREAFKLADEAHLAGGVDLVKTMELAAEDIAAGAKAATVRRQLDHGIAAQADKHAELKLLDGQLDELQERRAKLEERPAAGEAALRMLDQTGLRPKAKKGKKKLSIDEAIDLERRALPGQLSKGARKMDKRARKRMRRLGLSEHEYVKALEAEVRGEPMPPKPTLAAPETPPGVDGDSHDLHRRIRKFLLDNDLPESEYASVVERVYSGQVEL